MRERFGNTASVGFACAVLLALSPVLEARAETVDADAGTPRRGSVYSPELSGAPIILEDGGVAPRPDSAPAIATPSPESIPEVTEVQRSRTGIAANVVTFMVLLLKGVLGLLKRVGGASGDTPWSKAPPWAQWVAIAVVSALIALLDTWLTGASWGIALTEMGVAFMLSWTSDKLTTIAATNKVVARFATATGNTPAGGMQPPPAAPVGTTFRAGGTNP